MKPTPALRTPIIEILQKAYPEYCLRHIDTADEIIKYLIKQDDWIPIIAGDVSGLPDGEIWLTIKTPSGTFEKGRVTGEWAKTQIFLELMTAWMPYYEPKPYKP